MTPPKTAFVVRDAAGKLVMAFWGPAAAEEARTWIERGYTVTEVEPPTLP